MNLMNEHPDPEMEREFLEFQMKAVKKISFECVLPHLSQFIFNDQTNIRERSIDFFVKSYGCKRYAADELFDLAIDVSLKYSSELN